MSLASNPGQTYSSEAGADEGLEREKSQGEESKASHLESGRIEGEGKEEEYTRGR